MHGVSVRCSMEEGGVGGGGGGGGVGKHSTRVFS